MIWRQRKGAAEEGETQADRRRAGGVSTAPGRRTARRLAVRIAPRAGRLAAGPARTAPRGERAEPSNHACAPQRTAPFISSIAACASSCVRIATNLRAARRASCGLQPQSCSAAGAGAQAGAARVRGAARCALARQAVWRAHPKPFERPVAKSRRMRASLYGHGMWQGVWCVVGRRWVSVQLRGCGPLGRAPLPPLRAVRRRNRHVGAHAQPGRCMKAASSPASVTSCRCVSVCVGGRGWGAIKGPGGRSTSGGRRPRAKARPSDAQHATNHPVSWHMHLPTLPPGAHKAQTPSKHEKHTQFNSSASLCAVLAVSSCAG